MAKRLKIKGEYFLKNEIDAVFYNFDLLNERYDDPIQAKMPKGDYVYVGRDIFECKNNVKLFYKADAKLFSENI